jgi:hypothetical protein
MDGKNGREVRMDRGAEAARGSSRLEPELSGGDAEPQKLEAFAVRISHIRSLE